MDEKGQGILLPVMGLALTAVIAFIIFAAVFNPLTTVGQTFIVNLPNSGTVNLLINLIPLIIAAGILLTIWGYLQFERQQPRY